MRRESSFMLFSGSSHEGLAKQVANILGIQLGEVEIEGFPDGEIGIRILETVRGKDVFVIQSPARRPNHFLMELLVMVDALKRASARSIVAILPYYPYARQDRKERGRVPITARLVADLLEKAGVTRLLTMDLHTDQIEGFFNIPVDHLRARPLLVRALQDLRLKNPVVVAPDVGNSRMARKYAEDLRADLAIIDKRRVNAKTVAFNALIGDVADKQVVLVDDICSTGGTLMAAAEVCRTQGASEVIAAVTHGLWAGNALPSGFDRFLVTDSIPALNSNVDCVSIASYIAEAIQCIVSMKSISSLFKT